MVFACIYFVAFLGTFKFGMIKEELPVIEFWFSRDNVPLVLLDVLKLKITVEIRDITRRSRIILKTNFVELFVSPREYFFFDDKSLCTLCYS